jgi:pseudoazurin
MNFQNIARIVFIFVLIIFLPLISWAKNYRVEMLNDKDGQAMVFEPAFLKVEKGDQITFVPVDAGHNSRSVFVPEGSNDWKGENNQEVIFSYQKEGVYIYQCSNHSVMGMVGVIQVGKPSNLEEAKKFIKNYKKKIAINKDRLDKYISQIK